MILRKALEYHIMKYLRMFSEKKVLLVTIYLNLRILHHNDVNNSFNGIMIFSILEKKNHEASAPPEGSIFQKKIGLKTDFLLRRTSDVAQK